MLLFQSTQLTLKILDSLLSGIVLISQVIVLRILTRQLVFELDNCVFELSDFGEMLLILIFSFRIHILQILICFFLLLILFNTIVN